LEELGRTLGRWRSFGCSGFGIHGEELANRAGERKPLKLCLWRREEEEDEQEMREPELELRRWRRTFWTSEATSKGNESCSTAGTRQRPAGSSVPAWATARRRFPIGYGLSLLATACSQYARSSWMAGAWPSSPGKQEAPPRRQRTETRRFGRRRCSAQAQGEERGRD